MLSVVTAIGYVPADMVLPDGDNPGSAMIALRLAVITTVIAGLFGLIPLVVIAHKHPKMMPMAGICATCLRMVVTFLVGGLIYKIVSPNKNSFFACLCIYYVILVAWESLLAIKVSKGMRARLATEQDALKDGND
jgi:hypothetical protein